MRLPVYFLLLELRQKTSLLWTFLAVFQGYLLTVKDCSTTSDRFDLTQIGGRANTVLAAVTL